MTRRALALGLALLAACGGRADDPPASPAIVPGPVTPARPPAPPPEPPPPSDVLTTLVANEYGAEVQIATSSTGRIAVAWIGVDKNATVIRVALSDDGGATFGSPVSVGKTAGDPILGALDDGSFLVGGLRADCNAQLQCTNGEIFLARIPSGSATLEPLPSVFENGKLFIDHPWMSVNGTAVSIIGATFSADSTQSGMTVWRSTDRGATWERSEVVTLGAGGQIGIPRFCSGKGTRLWATYYDVGSTTGSTMRFTDTADQGWTAASTATPTSTDASLVTAEVCAVAGDTVYALLASPSPAQAPGGGGDPDVDALPAYASLHLVASIDQGKTWTALTSIDDGRTFLLPELAVEPDGTLDLFTYAGPDLGAGGANAELVRVHADGTKDKTIVLASDLVLEDARGSAKWLGDYNGVAWSAGKPVFAFGDNAIAETKIRFARPK